MIFSANETDGKTATLCEIVKCFQLHVAVSNNEVSELDSDGFNVKEELTQLSKKLGPISPMGSLTETSPCGVIAGSGPI